MVQNACVNLFFGVHHRPLWVVNVGNDFESPAISDFMTPNADILVLNSPPQNPGWDKKKKKKLTRHILISVLRHIA
jgi:hypothetical protein